MRTENEFKKIVSDNLIYYRKQKNLTQIQLAEILNYSDKSISKWERGESLPDLYILNNIAEIYGITVNDLLTEEKTLPIQKKKRSKTLITIMSFGLVWLVATVAFVLLEIFISDIKKAWLSFIVAIPISMIVLIVFSRIWGNKIQTFMSLTIFYWTVPLTLFLAIDYEKLWLLFLIIIPLQILTIFWFLFRGSYKQELKKEIL